MAVRSILIWWFLVLSLWAPLRLPAQGSIGNGLDSTSRNDLQQLDIQVIDSISLERIVAEIEATKQDSERSLCYIKLYEKLIQKYPDVPNRADRVYKLKGYRYNNLAWINNRSQTELAMRYLDTAQHSFDQAGFAEGAWLNLYGRGAIYKNMGDNEQALAHFDRYLAHYADPFDSAYVANVQFQRGVVLFQLGRFDESAAALIQAVRLDEGLGRRSSQPANTFRPKTAY